MSAKACVFVDGENFRHAIVKLFDEFNQTEYLPKKANWCDLFDWLVAQADKDAKRIRTYWYVIEKVDCFPYSFPNIVTEPDKLRAVLEKDKTCKDKFKTLNGIALTDEMTKIVELLKKRQRSMTQRIAGWEALQNGISTKHKYIEFRRAGAIKYDLFTEKLGKEKAVDVKLSADMITLKDIYDIALIVSGDQDYVPAVQVVKDTGKHVINVSFEKRNGQLLPGGAWRLNQVTDWNLKISHGDLKGFLKI